MGLELVREVRGAMTRFDVLTPEHVTRFSEGNCTYEQLAADLVELGLDIKNVVVDESRKFQNAYYADYENGWYDEVYLYCEKPDNLLHLVSRIKKFGSKNPQLLNKNWDMYYLCSVPLPMSIYDFQKRYRDIDPSEVFEVWTGIAKDMDGLDRVRFNGLDYRQLRTPYAKRLPLVAGGLLEEKLVEVLQQAIDRKLEVPGFA